MIEAQREMTKVELIEARTEYSLKFKVEGQLNLQDILDLKESRQVLQKRWIQNNWKEGVPLKDQPQDLIDRIEQLTM